MLRLSHINFIDLMDNLCLDLKLERQTLQVTETPVKTEEMPLPLKLNQEESKATLLTSPEETPIPSSPSPKTYSINYFLFESKMIDSDLSNSAAASEEKSIKKRFAVFYLSRDQAEVREDFFSFLPVAKDVIEAFYQQFPEEKATMLLPIHQCGANLGLHKVPVEQIGYTRDGFVTSLNSFCSFFNGPAVIRDHIVLAEVNPYTKSITIHDSQNSMNSLFYSNSVTLTGYTNSYVSHGNQTDRDLCGYYVFSFVYAYLLHETQDFTKIKIDQNIVQSKEYFLNNWQTIVGTLLAKRSFPSNDVIEKEKEVVQTHDEADGVVVSLKSAPRVGNPINNNDDDDWELDGEQAEKESDGLRHFTP